MVIPEPATLSADAVKSALVNFSWEDGKHFPVVYGPYRYRIIIHCSTIGRRTALFSNGEHPYFAYVEVADDEGNWVRQGMAGIVPVLPDGRVLMIVEQRPAQQGRFQNNMMMRSGGSHVDLTTFGPHSSLEFPGGALDHNESVQLGSLRELCEETGVIPQQATLIRRVPPLYSEGANFAIRGFTAIAELSNVSFNERVDTDGGLHVIALSPEDVVHNVRSGVIVATHVAVMPWHFYEEVCRARQDGSFGDLITDGYIAVEHVNI